MAWVFNTTFRLTGPRSSDDSGKPGEPSMAPSPTPSGQWWVFVPVQWLAESPALAHWATLFIFGASRGFFANACRSSASRRRQGVTTEDGSTTRNPSVFRLSTR